MDEWSAVADAERELTGTALSDISPARWLMLKRLGLADARIAELIGSREPEVRDARIGRGCGRYTKRSTRAPLRSRHQAPYFYSTYEVEDELPIPERQSVIILGAGPNRIGQGIEFDYCCVQAVATFRDLATTRS